jgi:protein subunit release factor B
MAIEESSDKVNQRDTPHNLIGWLGDSTNTRLEPTTPFTKTQSASEKSNVEQQVAYSVVNYPP